MQHAHINLLKYTLNERSFPVQTTDEHIQRNAEVWNHSQILFFNLQNCYLDLA